MAQAKPIVILDREMPFWLYLVANVGTILNNVERGDLINSEGRMDAVVWWRFCVIAKTSKQTRFNSRLERERKEKRKIWQEYTLYK